MTERIKQELLKKAMLVNPYMKHAIPFQIDGKDVLLIDNEIVARETLDKQYADIAMKDIVVGVNDRKAGYYDKWYRYNRCDGGRAYDIGVQYATTLKTCSEEMRIIPA